MNKLKGKIETRSKEVVKKSRRLQHLLRQPGQDVSERPIWIGVIFASAIAGMVVQRFGSGFHFSSGRLLQMSIPFFLRML